MTEEGRGLRRRTGLGRLSTAGSKDHLSFMIEKGAVTTLAVMLRLRTGLDLSRTDGRDRRARDRLDAVANAMQQPRPTPPRGAGYVVATRARVQDLLFRARTTWAVRALPTVRLDITDSGGGRAILASMATFCGGHQAQHLRARSAYVIPRDGQPYKGRHSHSRRNAVNRARIAGIRIESIAPGRLVTDTAVQVLGICPDAPACEGLSLVAFSERSELLAISHVHVDGCVAELRQAVHVAHNSLTGPVRYAMFHELVKELAARDVDVMVVLTSYLQSGPGLRTYQHILGYRPVNLRVQPAGRPSPRSMLAVRRGATARAARTP